jgi:hypothetical protein
MQLYNYDVEFEIASRLDTDTLVNVLEDFGFSDMLIGVGSNGKRVMTGTRLGTSKQAVVDAIQLQMSNTSVLLKEITL